MSETRCFLWGRSWIIVLFPWNLSFWRLRILWRWQRCKTHPRTSHEDLQGGTEVEVYPFFNLYVSLQLYSPHLPATVERKSVPILLENEWNPRAVLEECGKHITTGIQHPELPACTDYATPLRLTQKKKTFISSTVLTSYHEMEHFLYEIRQFCSLLFFANKAATMK